MSNEMVEVIGGIIIVAVLLGLLLFIRYRKTKNKEDAIKFLEGLANTFYKNILKLLTTEVSIYKEPLAVVEKKLLDMIYNSAWEYIETYAKDAVDQDEITKALLAVINREFVDNFVSGLIERFKVKDMIEDKWKEAQIDDDFVARVEAEDKALQEKFSDENLYNTGEIDKYKDLELAEAGVAYTLTEDGIVDEIEKPADVEDPKIDTVEDESVEILDEDGLTAEEKEAGVHFNKKGRKIDKHGRFVK